jgi:site-specific recombinase XerD
MHMPRIYCRLTKNNQTKYYSDIHINGQRVRKHLAGNLKSAGIALKKLEYKLIFNPPSNNSKKKDIPLNHAIISFLKEVEASGISDHRVKTIRLKLNAFRDYCYKSLLADITVRIAKNYMQQRANDRVTNKYHSKQDNYYPTLSPKTYNQELQIFIRFFNHCIELGWLEKNPFTLVKTLIDKPKGERYYFRDNDLKHIFKLFQQYSDIYNILLHTGIRFTDAYMLCPLSVQNGYLTLQMHKTSDYLKVPLPRSVLAILEPRLNGDYIFPELQSERQRIRCRRAVQSIFDPDFVRKNNINLHTFRHTYAHNMLNKGVPKEVLQTLLGHRSIKTTEIYANWVRKEELERWV